LVADNIPVFFEKIWLSEEKKRENETGFQNNNGINNCSGLTTELYRINRVYRQTSLYAVFCLIDNYPYLWNLSWYLQLSLLSFSYANSLYAKLILRSRSVEYNETTWAQSYKTFRSLFFYVHVTRKIRQNDICTKNTHV